MEFDLIDLIRERTASPRDDVRLGIGDDAALLAPPRGHELVVAIDTLVAGVHFLPDAAPADIGWQALAVNLSDLAAMGAEPAWALLALTLPTADRGFVEAFADGFAELARTYHVALVGGDTTGGPLTVSVCVHGFVPAGQALRRGGAEVGDLVFVTGTLGDAAAALHCLDDKGAPAQQLRACLDRPSPRVAAGIALRGLAHACIDVSDGLLADLGHICRASGVGAVVEVADLPMSEALRARFNVAAAREFALTGGDAYELCFTAPPARADAVRAALAPLDGGVTCIGQIVAGEDVHARDAEGNALAPPSRGWEHFAA